MTDQRKNALRHKLQEARLRLLLLDDTFAEPLIEMLFVATGQVRRISTNGTCIYFDPNWLAKLSDFALDFALAHQLMHIRLGHIDRPCLYQGDRYHLACDIVANAKLCALGLAAESIPGLGKIYTQTFFPRQEGSTLTAEEAFDMVPFDPALLKKGQRDRYLIDDESWWNEKQDRGAGGRIVLSPNDPEPDDRVVRLSYLPMIGKGKNRPAEPQIKPSTDQKPQDKPEWEKNAEKSIRALREIKSYTADSAADAQSAVRIWHPLMNSKLNWKELLQHFLQDTRQDYSFAPPDKRYSDSEFFLPDFHEVTDSSKEILLYVDTSGSVSNESLSLVAAEICGAMEQFEGMMEGTLLFFDTVVYPQAHFRTVGDIIFSVPKGGGGTDYCCVLQHAEKMCRSKEISGIIIFTDGEGTYPQTVDLRIPVFWIINNKMYTPPFGTVARL